MSENEKKVLNEEMLEDVSGGWEPEGDCFFVPEMPIEKRLYDGAIMVKCASNCRPFKHCACLGSLRCKDKYHRVTQTGTKWGPAPANENNHQAADKLFNMPD